MLTTEQLRTAQNAETPCKMRLFVADNEADFDACCLPELGYYCHPERLYGKVIHPRIMLDSLNVALNAWNYTAPFEVRTCSEYVVLWALWLVREGKIGVSELEIYWRKPNSIDYVEVKYDAEGELDDWPSPFGFWKDRGQLLF